MKELDGSKLYTIPLGAAPQAGGGGGGGGFGGGGANNPVFSDDSRWVGYYVNPPGRLGGSGGRPGGAGATGRAWWSRWRAAPILTRDACAGSAGRPASRSPTRRFELLDLAERREVHRARTRRASSSPKAAVGSPCGRTRRTPTDTTHDGTDLILRDLATGATRNIGNASAFAFDDAGQRFAYTVDAIDRLGNGVYLIDLATGQTRTLASAALDFDGLAWSDKGTNLAVLRGDKAKTSKQKDNVLLAWSDAGAPNARMVEYDPAKDALVPEGHGRERVRDAALEQRRRARLRRAQGAGSRAARRATSRRRTSTCGTGRIRTRSRCRSCGSTQERRFTYPAVVLRRHEEVHATRRPRHARRARRRLTASGRSAASTRRIGWRSRGAAARRISIAINTETGERTLIDKAVTRTMGISPDSKWFLYLKDKHVFAYNLETGKKSDLDDGEKISLLDAEDDHPYEIPTYGVAGWSKDGRSVLLNHRYDIWQLPLDGGKAVEPDAGRRRRPADPLPAR